MEGGTSFFFSFSNKVYVFWQHVTIVWKYNLKKNWVYYETNGIIAKQFTTKKEIDYLAYSKNLILYKGKKNICIIYYEGEYFQAIRKIECKWRLLEKYAECFGQYSKYEF